MRDRLSLLWLALAVLLSSSVSSRAYIVGPAVPLDKLAQRSDLVFKGTVLSESAATSSDFRPVEGFRLFETRFRIVSVVKGRPAGDTISFLHYDRDPALQPISYEPQHYHFTSGQTYLVFAAQSPDDPPDVYRQLWMNHTSLEDEGVLLCANDKPVSEKPLQAIFWDELTGLLGSDQPQTAIYAIHLLGRLSGIDGESDYGLSEFKRDAVIDALKDLPRSPNSDLAQAALFIIGSQNPYMTEERAPYWLGTVGSADTVGLAKVDPKLKNAGATRYAGSLIALADSAAPAATRALAIRTFGLTRDPAIKKPLKRWLADHTPEIRASAVILLADFPDLATSDRLTALAADPSPGVRAAVALAIGYGQYFKQADILSSLLGDKDSKVRKFASQSLLSFSPEEGNVAKIFKANLTNREFTPLFLLALARKDPGPYRDALADVVTNHISPTNWDGGQIPAFTAWILLFQYLKAQPEDRIRNGEFDHYLDVLEKVGDYSSSEPQKIYAFFLLRGLPERAKKYRARTNSERSYDMNYYFNMVDAHPSDYLID